MLKKDHIRAIVESAADVIVSVDCKGNIIFWNNMAERVFGYSADEIIGKPLVIIISDKYRDIPERLMRQAISPGKSKLSCKAVELIGLGKNGNEIPIELTISLWKMKEEKYYTIVIREIAKQKIIHESLQKEIAYKELLQNIAMAASNAKTVEEVFQVCVDNVCSLTGWPVGHVYRVDSNHPDLLQSTKIWYLDDHERFRAFKQVTEDTRFTVGDGLPGRVLQSGKPVWVIGIRKDPRYPRTKFIEVVKIKTGFGFPVLIREKVVGVLEFFSTDIVEPDKHLMGVMSHIGAQLGRVIERNQAEEEREVIQRLSRRLTEPLTLKEVGKIVAEESRKLFHHDAFSFDLIDRAENTLVGLYNEDTPSGKDEPEAVPTRSYSLTAERNQEVLEGKPLLINRKKRSQGRKNLRFGDKERLSRSLMFVPVLWKDQAVGILSVQSYVPDRYDKKDLELLQTFANQCGGALARIRVQEALLVSEERYRTVVESSPSYIFLLDQEGRILDMNPAVGQEELEFLITSRVFDDIYPEDRGLFEEKINACFVEGGIHEFEVRSLHGSDTYQIMLGPVEMSGGLADYIVCHMYDITERKRAIDALEYRMQLEQLIGRISSYFINLPVEDIGNGINAALESIGEFTGIDRSYIFLLSNDGKRISNTHEWCADGIRPEIDNLQELPVEMFPWWMEKLNNFEEIVIPRVADLPPEAGREKAILDDQNIRSLVVAPMVYVGKLIGFLGFDSVRVERSWSDEIIRLINIIGEIFTNAIQHKRAGEELEKSAEKYRTIVETSHDLIWTTDLEGNITFINRRGSEMMGYDTDDLLGKNITNYISSKDQSKARNCFVNVIKQHETYTFELGISSRRGNVITLLVTEIPIIENGAVVGVMTFGSDVTERRKIEAALVESEKRYRDLVQGIDAIVWEADIESGRFTFVSQKAEEILGYPINEWLTKPDFWKAILHPDDRKTATRYFERSVRNGTDHEYVYRTVAADGRVVWVRNILHFVKDKNDRIGKLRGIIIDITKQKLAEQALRESKERFSLAVRGTKDGIWTWDFKSGETYFSDRWKRMLGYGKNEIKNTFEAWRDLIHPDDLERVLKIWDKHLSGKDTSFSLEYRLRSKSNNYIWIECRGFVMKDEQGNPLKLAGSHTDITDRKEAEQKLKRTAEDLVRSNAELEQFAYVASHDLQEPLRMVGSYTQLLARRYKNHLDEDANEFIDYILDGVKRMQTLINDLLIYSRVGTRGKPFTQINSAEILEAKLQDLKLAIEESNAVVTYDTLPTILADGVQIGQLFQNLISNAIKFRNNKPPRVHIGAGEKKGQWVFSVKDNGIGIEPRYKDRIFVIFQRLHTLNEYPGTGIGLAVCKKIVERHGGKIWFESELGIGTTFYFSIPKTQGV